MFDNFRKIFYRKLEKPNKEAFNLLTEAQKTEIRKIKEDFSQMFKKSPFVLERSELCTYGGEKSLIFDYLKKIDSMLTENGSVILSVFFGFKGSDETQPLSGYHYVSFRYNKIDEDNALPNLKEGTPYIRTESTFGEKQRYFFETGVGVSIKDVFKEKEDNEEEILFPATHKFSFGMGKMSALVLKELLMKIIDVSMPESEDESLKNKRDLMRLAVEDWIKESTV